MRKMHSLFTVLFCFLLISLTLSCNKDSQIILNNHYAGNSNYTICEKSYSRNGQHEIFTLVTPNSGMGVDVDGIKHLYDFVGVIYSPVISDDGNYAWLQENKGKGYDVIWNNKSILHSGVCLDFLTVGKSAAVCVQSDNGQNITRLFSIDLSNGECKCISVLRNEYIEDVFNYADNMFAIETSFFDDMGHKLYNVYSIEILGNANNIDIQKIIDDKNFLLINKAVSNDKHRLVLDEITMSDNDRYLFNALAAFVWGGIMMLLRVVIIFVEDFHGM